MIKKALVVVIFLSVALTLGGSVIYLGNSAPAVPAVSTEQAAQAGRPYVVKLHARWCIVCAVTKDVWSQIEETYSGRVHLIVLDFTNDATTEASKTEATRLGLDSFFHEYSGATGTIVVLDGRSRETLASINGSRDFAEYRVAIDAAMARTIGRD